VVNLRRLGNTRCGSGFKPAGKRLVADEESGASRPYLTINYARFWQSAPATLGVSGALVAPTQNR
jgi:hypothetical protein